MASQFMNALWNAIRPDTLRSRLISALGGEIPDKLQIVNRRFPEMRTVDIMRAIDRFVAVRGGGVIIDAVSHWGLNDLLAKSPNPHVRDLKVFAPLYEPRAVGFEAEETFPTQRFWIVPATKSSGFYVLYLPVRQMMHEFSLEVAARTTDEAEAVLSTLQKDSVANSIYRGHLVQIEAAQGVKNDYGEEDFSPSIRLTFKQENRIARDQIVLEDRIHEILDRNVFRFFRDREKLQRLGLPLRRGLLFYGPPGTGKTFTSKYLFSNLEQVTTFIVTGQSLPHIKSVCHLARMLNPSLVVLEDVDLVFAAREINLYSSALGDLMDELDGFQPDEQIVFVLTTNAIERLETAIKDRPGRINQCLYFGHPDAELRKRYLIEYLKPYQTDRIELDRLVDLTDDCSQAFLKELVFRAVQFATERISTPAASNGRLELIFDDMAGAYDEMTRYSESETASIMGFAPRGRKTN